MSGDQVPPGAPVPAVLARIKGQPRAVAELGAAARLPVHAYLLVGPPGSGKREAAVAFAAALLCPLGGCGRCEVCRRVLAETHPDLIVLDRTGASITVGEAREISRLAVRTPTEADRKVLVLTDFHLVGPAAPALLKTVEEPPASAVFVITAERVTPELVTIASRCLRIGFSPLAVEEMAAVLRAEGIEPVTAAGAAGAARGRLDRARRLAGDPGFSERRRAWSSVPDRLDGTGATAVVLAADLLESCEAALEPLRRRQAEEAAALAERGRLTGEAGGAREMEDRHRREQRRVRTDELRGGLTALAEAYRDRVLGGDARRADAAASAALAVDRAGQALIRNPNEALLLQALFLELGG